MFLFIVSFWISLFTKWKAFSIRFTLGLRRVMHNTKDSTSSYTLSVATEFWMGHPSWKNGFAPVLALLSNMEGECSRVVYTIVPPDNFVKYCSYGITPLLYAMAPMKRARRTPYLLPQTVQQICSPSLIHLHSHAVVVWPGQWDSFYRHTKFL